MMPMVSNMKNSKFPAKDMNRRDLLKATGFGIGTVAAFTGIAAPAILSTPAQAANSTRQTRKTYSFGANQLDIYPARSPARLSDTGLAPVIAFVHGGAWRMG